MADEQGTMREDGGDAKAQHSGTKGGSNESAKQSDEPAASDKAENKLDPSAPGETGTTPGSNTPAN